jgi:hypothetical protein
VEFDRHEVLLPNLTLQISPIQEDIYFIQEGFPGFNLQIRKKDRTLHARASFADILRGTPLVCQIGYGRKASSFKIRNPKKVSNPKFQKTPPE